ncbi:glutathione S-transferase family protein [Microbulbifer bruguierae]|uniref:Glutathione S-transferase family protein n=1 Tax=Microbulbifer bruguierae TaxID=3029061 RepID=A0ABY8NH47_9GAMM|nr:glutathione S-transferase family protein [Microbulbifer bruguierae]WGL16848.1 glutathione S-transferase family protein [Microbulbifer bruguierae]
MKLYTVPHSPYGARVCAQIKLKNLPVEVLPPPEPLRSEGFLKRFALGKVPILELDDGRYLGESWAILEYLEEIGGEIPSLIPKDALARGKMRELARYADLHLAPNALFPLFKSVLAGEAVTASTLDALHTELAKGERLIAARGSLAERALDLGDIALAPSVLYLFLLLEGLGKKEILADFPAFSGWWEGMDRIPEIRETLQGVSTAFRAFAGSRATA